MRATWSTALVLAVAPACGSGGGDACGSPPCGPVSLAQMQTSPGPIAAASGHVAWIDHPPSTTAEGVVRLVGAGGGPVMELADVSGVFEQRWNDIAVDDQNVYWDENEGNVGRLVTVPVTGGTPRTLYQVGPVASVSSAVATGGAVYVVSSVDRIIRIDPQTAAVTPIAADPSCGGPLAVDAENLYCVAQGGVTKVPLAGGASSLLAAVTSPNLVRTIAIDDTSLYVLFYASSDTTYSLEKIALTGGQPVMLASGLEVRSQTLVAAEPGLFWIGGPASGGHDPLMRLDPNGGTPVVADPMGDAVYLAADARNVYLAQSSGNINELAF